MGDLQLALEVKEAARTFVNVGSDEDEARDYLCRIAASRFSKLILDCQRDLELRGVNRGGVDLGDDHEGHDGT